MAEAGEENAELLCATLDLADIGIAQTSLPWWRDRRPELYDTLLRAP
jgi:predicted amidohydrolase